MKVLFVTSAGAPPIGGEGVYMESIIPALEARGITVRVLVLCTSDEKQYQHTADDRVSYIRVRDPYTYHGLLARNIIAPLLYRRIRKELRIFNPDVVHLHTVFFLKTVLYAVRHIPTIQTFHEISQILPLFPTFFAHDPNTHYRGELDIHTGRRAGLKRRTIFIDHYIFDDRRMSRKVTRLFLCPSRYIAHVAQEAKLEPAVYIPHFREVSDIVVPQKKDEGEAYFLFVGRLEKLKGVDHLLRTFALLKKEGYPARLRIAGDGSSTPQLKRYAQEMGISDQVEFLGWIENHALADYYAGADAVIIPSIYPEAGPLVALEAMGYGVPVIAYRVGGLPELVKNEETGLTVERGDIHGLAAACKKIQTDPIYAQRLGRTAQKEVATYYTKEAHIDKLMAIYASLCKF